VRPTIVGGRTAPSMIVRPPQRSPLLAASAFDSANHAASHHYTSGARGSAPCHSELVEIPVAIAEEDLPIDEQRDDKEDEVQPHHRQTQALGEDPAREVDDSHHEGHHHKQQEDLHTARVGGRGRREREQRGVAARGGARSAWGSAWGPAGLGGRRARGA
jgi:hypothetical protein